MKNYRKNTRIFKVDPNNMDRGALSAAAEVIRQGGTVVFPTETVYGLGANALSADAVAGIFEAKGRPSDNPLIVHVASQADALALTEEIPESASVLMDAFWPGPLTLVMKKKAVIPAAVTAGLDTFGVRMPHHPVALALIAAAGLPIAAPSANLSGRPSPTSGQHVIQDLMGRVDMILDSGDTGIGLESTVLDLTGPIPTILRPGGVTREDLYAFLPRVDQAADDTVDEAVPRSPGMKYRHYAPKAPLQVVVGDPQKMQEAIWELGQQYCREGKKVGVLVREEHRFRYPGFVVAAAGQESHPEVTAQKLYAMLRWLDEQKVDVILAEGVASEGLGTAIMNRLCKAAGYKILRV